MNINPETSRLSIQCAHEPWMTEIDGEITEIKINGRRINDVHDLTQRVVGMTKTIKVLAYAATTLAVLAVGTVMWLAQWLLSHESSIEQLLLTGNQEYDVIQEEARSWRSHKRQRAWVHLKSFHGLQWDDEQQDWSPRQ